MVSPDIAQKIGMPIRPLLYLTILLTGAVLSCCVLPKVVLRVTCGNWPIGDPNKYAITAGMTREEISSSLGPPHHREATEEGEKWCYHCDAFGFAILRILFDKNGRVLRDWW